MNWYRRWNDFLKQNKLTVFWEVFLFCVITYGFHLLYRANVFSFRDWPWIVDINQWLIDVVFHQSFFLDKAVLGMDVEAHGRTIWFPEENGYVAITLGCTGFKQFYQTVVLFLLYPGPWKHKLWYIPMGILVMHMTNVLRIVVMSYAVIYWPEHWDFIHDWIARPFFYVVMFGLWMVWNEQFKGRS